MKKTDKLHLKYQISNSLQQASSLIDEIISSIDSLKIFTDEHLKKITFVLMETVTNAIEHGNLEISAEQKAEMLTNFDSTYDDFVEKRKQTEPFASRKVVIEIKYIVNQLTIIITDQGNGFKRKDIENNNVPCRESFRGLEMCKLYASSLEFNDTGNSVTVSFDKNSI